MALGRRFHVLAVGAGPRLRPRAVFLPAIKIVEDHIPTPLFFRQLPLPTIRFIRTDYPIDDRAQITGQTPRPSQHFFRFRQ